MSSMNKESFQVKFWTRRSLFNSLFGGGVALAVPVLGEAASAEPSLPPEGSETLQALQRSLKAASRRRDFVSVPKLLTDQLEWDQKALQDVVNYRSGPKQVWHVSDIKSPWLILVRNSLNVELWAYKHPDMLAAVCIHGPAHLSLLDDYIWAKYNLSKRLELKVNQNPYLSVRTSSSAQEVKAGGRNADELKSSDEASIDALMDRGVAFLACHNSLWEIGHTLIESDQNPDHLTQERLTAELTNHLIPGAILTPGIVATILQLQTAGFHYIKA